MSVNQTTERVTWSGAIGLITWHTTDYDIDDLTQTTDVMQSKTFTTRISLTGKTLNYSMKTAYPAQSQHYRNYEKS